MSVLNYCFMSFKKVFGPDTVSLLISPGWSYEQFIDNTYSILSREFEIPKEQMELVESGQPKLENAPALTFKPNETLAMKWGNRLQFVSFYVRKRVEVEPLEASSEERELSELREALTLLETR